MLRKQSKEKALFDYADKVLSLQRPCFIQPFPKNIEQLLVIYIHLCYYIGVFPYRLVHNSKTLQYETKSNPIHRVLYCVVWFCCMVEFIGTLIMHIKTATTQDPLSILLLLGGVGHLFNYLTFIVTIFYYRENIKDLVNYFSSYSSSSFGITSPSSVPFVHNHATTDATQSKMATQDGFEKSGSGSTEKLKRILTFKRIAILLWLITLIAGIKCTGIVGKIVSGNPVIGLETGELYKFINASTTPNLDAILSSSTFSAHLLPVVLNLIFFSANMNNFCWLFIYGLEIMIALSMKFISSHFTSSLTATADIWKPSSSNVLASFIVVRNSFRMINHIFGWLMQYSIMGEFPNFTFNVVFYYQNPSKPMGFAFTAGMAYVSLILSSASWVVNELSKLKDWLQYEDKRHWSLSSGDSLHRRIILFELSLNRYALYAHGFFQLSLPAIVSIAAGILSNALIIFQLALSKSVSTSNT